MSDDLGTPSDANPEQGSANGAVSAPVASGSRDASYWEAQARSWQSRYDQAAARSEALTTQAPVSAPAAPEGSGLTAADIEGVIRREMIRSRTFLSEAESLRSKHPDVAALAPNIFQDPTQFDSPEAMRAAVESLDQALNERWAEREAQLREELGRPRPAGVSQPPVSSEHTAGGLPTIEQIQRMTSSEMDRFEKLNPGLIEQITIAAMAE